MSYKNIVYFTSAALILTLWVTIPYDSRKFLKTSENTEFKDFSKEDIELFIKSDSTIIDLGNERPSKEIKSKGKVVTHVTLTTYNPVKEQCDNTPLVTANMTKIDLKKLKRGELKICAISRNLLYLIPMGSRIHIEGHGEYVVADLMNKRFSHCIDILQHNSEPNFKKEKVKITLLST